MHWVYYFGRGLARLLLRLLSRWSVIGRENLPERGPVLVVCNHLHIADPPIVATSIPLKSVFMAKDELFHQAWSRFWVKNFGAFPVRRRGIDREAFRQAETWLKRGVSLIMFPEGGRSPTGTMRPALPGAAMIATRLGVPILPVSISGTEKLRERWWWLKRPRVTVTIGRPFVPPGDNGRATKEEIKALTADMMGRIAGLLPEKYRGVYA